jgi:hypothetical protein
MSKQLIRVLAPGGPARRGVVVGLTSLSPQRVHGYHDRKACTVANTRSVAWGGCSPLTSTCSTPTGNHRAAAATLRDSFGTCEAYRNGSLRQLNTRTIRRSGENNGLDAVVASPFPQSEIGVCYLVMPAGMLRCHEVHDPEYASGEARTGAHMLVVGTGALGSMVAAYVRRAGETVPVAGPWGACVVPAPLWGGGVHGAVYGGDRSAHGARGGYPGSGGPSLRYGVSSHRASSPAGTACLFRAERAAQARATCQRVRGAGTHRRGVPVCG